MFFHQAQQPYLVLVFYKLQQGLKVTGQDRFRFSDDRARHDMQGRSASASSARSPCPARRRALGLRCNRLTGRRPLLDASKQFSRIRQVCRIGQTDDGHLGGGNR